jgi:3-oxoacyl-[acyl-carrier protein] reductase
MDLGLRGRKALVTGGTRGIGRAIVETLAGEGANVALCARDAGQVRDTVAALKTKGVQAFGAAVDILDPAAYTAWIAQAAQQLGGLDILVSNVSAISRPSSVESWELGFRTDVLGSVRAVEAAKPFLLEAAATRGDAAIVFLASTAAAEAHVESAYGPVKAALIHYAKGLARQHAPKGLRANVVSPGTVFFEDGVWGREKRDNPAFFESMVKRNPTGRMATPQEIANAVVFLASPASSFTTGSNLVVDGAFTARVNY